MQALARRMAMVINTKRFAGGIRFGSVAGLEVRGALGGRE